MIDALKLAECLMVMAHMEDDMPNGSDRASTAIPVLVCRKNMPDNGIAVLIEGRVHLLERIVLSGEEWSELKETGSVELPKVGDAK